MRKLLRFMSIVVLMSSMVKAFSVPTRAHNAPSVRPKQSSGGRSPDASDRIGEQPDFGASPAAESEARLIVLQVTDVYTLENFASFQTLVEQTKAQSPGCKVITMLTGDFLSPYLLSSVDRGNGMMKALARIPMDYLTWGNHEADIEHRTVCRHVKNFPGKWLNSNMLDHDAMEFQQEYDIAGLFNPSPFLRCAHYGSSITLH